ncbi:MAG: DNA gyrase subunit A [Anaerolineae bacterium]
MAVDNLERTDIEQTMRVAYLNYAMSVITARALPDVRDGLKPVQRRVLYAMADMGLRHDQSTRKCARIVGEVLGKYHPHGESAVYDAMVRMAQDFSMRYPLVHGQGNFGSVDGDSAAAIRYTEAKLSAVGEELLIDLEKNTVAFVDNFDGSLKEPVVLPAKLPNLLLNGVGGIAVGMATNIPPHNLSEIVDAVAYLIDRYETAEDATVDELMQFISGPDFPTGGSIIGSEGIRQAYATGKGRVIVRAQAHIEDIAGGRQAIIVTELPYQVNKAGLVERIADLVRNGRIDGIADLRDESDRTGMRVVVELKRGIEVGPVINQLLKYTQMQNTFGVNMLALVDGEPRVLSLKRILLHYIEHRHDVIVRRSQYDLDKARARAHVLEGLLIALQNLDEVIQIIRRSRTADTAMANLCERFKLTEIQARAILDMQLRRLAALERRKIEEEYQEVLATITYLEGLLASKARILDLIKEDMLDLKERYGDPRRTRITAEQGEGELNLADLLPDERVMVLVTRDGTVRRMVESAWSANGQSEMWDGLGANGVETPLAQFVANSRDTVLFLTERGRCLQVATHQLPDAMQQPRGLPLRKLAPQAGEERLIAALHPGSLEAERFLTMATIQGKVKRLAFGELASANPGAQVIGLTEDDALGWATITDGKSELLLVTASGQALRFGEDSVRPQGRAGSGVRGITLADGDRVVGMDAVRAQGELVIATARGFAKRTPLSEYVAKGRATAGALTIDAGKADVTGLLVGVQVVTPGENVVFVTSEPRLVPTRLADVPRLARASWGRVVTRGGGGALVQLEGGVLTGMARLAAEAGPVTHKDATESAQAGTAARVAAPKTAAPKSAASKKTSSKKTTPKTPAGAKGTSAVAEEVASPKDVPAKKVSTGAKAGVSRRAKAAQTEVAPEEGAPASKPVRAKRAGVGRETLVAAPVASEQPKPSAPARARTAPDVPAAPTASAGKQAGAAPKRAARKATPTAAKGEPSQQTKEQAAGAPAQDKPGSRRSGRTSAEPSSPARKEGKATPGAQQAAETPKRVRRKADGAVQPSESGAPPEEPKPSEPEARVRTKRVTKPPVRSRPKSES